MAGHEMRLVPGVRALPSDMPSYDAIIPRTPEEVRYAEQSRRLSISTNRRFMVPVIFNFAAGDLNVDGTATKGQR